MRWIESFFTYDHTTLQHLCESAFHNVGPDFWMGAISISIAVSVCFGHVICCRSWCDVTFLIEGRKIVNVWTDVLWSWCWKPCVELLLWNWWLWDFIWAPSFSSHLTHNNTFAFSPHFFETGPGSIRDVPILQSWLMTMRRNTCNVSTYIRSWRNW